MPKKAHTSKTFENMLRALKDKGVGANSAKGGVSIIDDNGISFGFVSPTTDTHKDLNDFSAVCKLVYHNASFLFTGDAESTAESFITENVDVDVLKAGHHGSSTSSSQAFLNNVTPKYAVISCGTGNSYGHPHSETLTKYNSMGIEVYRTDKSGTIIFETDGTQYVINAQPTSFTSSAPTAPVIAPVATPAPTPIPTAPMVSSQIGRASCRESV